MSRVQGPARNGYPASAPTAYGEARVCVQDREERNRPPLRGL
jgi:hypothetical protein